jgi:cation diffusion facilitator CzcD-associated flavoprotein CzcO
MAMAVDYIGRASGRPFAKCPSREREAQLGGIVERLLQEFDQLVTDADGVTYRASVYGRSRPSDTWQGWLVFERVSDARRFSTDVETTQSSAEGILYWAKGLTNAYFDGALTRATQRRRSIEAAVLRTFGDRRTTRLLTQTVLDALEYSHADVVRALEDLEKQRGLIVRRTEEGNDWLALTELGTREADIQDAPRLAT